MTLFQAGIRRKRGPCIDQQTISHPWQLCIHEWKCLAGPQSGMGLRTGFDTDHSGGDLKSQTQESGFARCGKNCIDLHLFSNGLISKSSNLQTLS